MSYHLILVEERLGLLLRGLKSLSCDTMKSLNLLSKGSDILLQFLLPVGCCCEHSRELLRNRQKSLHQQQVCNLRVGRCLGHGWREVEGEEKSWFITKKKEREREREIFMEGGGKKVKN